TGHTRSAPLLPAKRGNWRRAKRTRESSFSHRAPPPPPANCNWHEGSNSSRNMHILTIGRRQLAEGVAVPMETCCPGAQARDSESFPILFALFLLLQC